MDNGLEDLWRRENQDSSEFTHKHHDRSSGTRSKIDRIYTDTKIANNAKIIHIMVSFTDQCNDISLHRLKLGKINGTLIILFYVSRGSPQLQIICFFIKNTKKHTLYQATGGNTPILVLKRMIGCFLKVPPLKKMLEFPD